MRGFQEALKPRHGLEVAGCNMRGSPPSHQARAVSTRHLNRHLAAADALPMQSCNNMPSATAALPRRQCRRHAVTWAAALLPTATPANPPPPHIRKPPGPDLWAAGHQCRGTAFILAYQRSIWVTCAGVSRGFEATTWACSCRVQHAGQPTKPSGTGGFNPPPQRAACRS